MPNSTERFSDRQYVQGRSARRSWDVIACADEEQVIATVQGEWAVAKGTTHPLDARLIAEAPEVTALTPAGRLWRYTLPYRSLTVSGGGGALDEPAKILWEPGFTTEPIDRDAFDNPIFNSAGDAPSTHLTEEFPTMVLHVTRWESSYDVQKYFAYRNRVNASQFTILNKWIVEAGQCRVLNYAPVEEFAIDATTVKNRYSFEFLSGNKKDADGLWDGFKKRFIDQGRNGFYTTGTGDTAVTNKDAIYFPSGARAGTDVLLNGYGKPAEIGPVIGKGLAEAVPNPKNLPSQVYRDDLSTSNGLTGAFLKYTTKKTVPNMAAIFN